MAQSMFYTKNVVAKKPKTPSTEDDRQRAATLGTHDVTSKDDKSRAISFSNPLQQMVGYVQRKFTPENPKEEQSSVSDA